MFSEIAMSEEELVVQTRSYNRKNLEQFVGSKCYYLYLKRIWMWFKNLKSHKFYVNIWEIDWNSN